MEVALLFSCVYYVQIMKRTQPWRRPVPEVAREFREWMRDTATTQADLASMLRVSQPQVSRILRGDFGKRSRAAQKLSHLAKVPLVSARRPTPGDPSTPLEALRDQLSLTSSTPASLPALEQTLRVWAKAQRGRRAKSAR